MRMPGERCKMEVRRLTHATAGMRVTEGRAVERRWTAACRQRPPANHSLEHGKRGSRLVGAERGGGGLMVRVEKSLAA